MRFFCSLAVVVGLAGWSARALAQVSYGASTVIQGDGFRLSDTGHLHLMTNIDSHYDSNVGYQPAGIEIGDFVLRLRGGVRLDQPSDAVAISTGIVADWTQYLGVFSASTRSLSALQGVADLGLVFHQKGMVSGSLSENFSRIDAPTVVSINQRLASVHNVTRAGIDVRPGAFAFNASYAFDIDWYDPNQPVVVNSSSLSVYSHELHLQAEWKFFPKTALTLEADQWFTRYLNDALGVDADANPLNVRAGIIGQFTDKLVLRVNAGYANVFLSGPLAAAATSDQTVVGLAQLTWRPFDVITISTGYTRGVLPTSLYGWYSFDRAYLDYQQLFFGRMMLGLAASYEYNTFGKPLFSTDVVDRQDNYIRAEARVTVAILRWLGASAYYDPEMRLTNYHDVSGHPGTYVRHVVGIDATFGY